MITPLFRVANALPYRTATRTLPAQCRALAIGLIALIAGAGAASASPLVSAPEYALPPAASWLHGRCGRHDCNLYQIYALRNGIYLSKHSTLYKPSVIVEVGANGARGRVQLTGAPYSLCAFMHADPCSVDVRVGDVTKPFAMNYGNAMEISPAQNFVAFAGTSKFFVVSYLDERRKQVRIQFDAAQIELRPPRLDR